MRKTSLVVVSVVGVALMLGGCALLNPETPRDSNGRVTESAVISAQDLLKGDCFTFNSADGGVVEQVTVMPCAQPHEYIVIGQGKLSLSAVTSAGSLQNAVSAACKPDFDAFKAAIKGDTRPKQEFIVFSESDKPGANQRYSCVSTDPDHNFSSPSTNPDQNSIPATPEPTPTP